jgi:hypothetical protein
MIARYGPDESARILGWARDAGSCAFDVLLKREIQTGDAANLRYGLAARSGQQQRSWLVTYVDNHDTGASPWSAANGWGQKHWECPPDFKRAAYAFVLCMPGIPCVYWPDCFDWGFDDLVRQLIAIRQRAGIIAGSEWHDLGDRHSGFAGLICDARGEQRLALAIRSDWPGPDPDDGWTVAYEQPGDFMIWERG